MPVIKYAIASLIFVSCAYELQHEHNIDSGIVDAAFPSDSSNENDASVVEDASTHDALGDQFSVSDVHISSTCPNICLDLGEVYDCNGATVYCISQWNPAWVQDCYSTLDKRYCSLQYWSSYCSAQKLNCWSRCIDDCNSCVAFNGCIVAPYDCQEFCQQQR